MAPADGDLGCAADRGGRDDNLPRGAGATRSLAECDRASDGDAPGPARFAALVLAAESYVHDGRPLTALAPAEVYKLGLMPPGWIVVPKRSNRPGMMAG